MCLNWVGQRKGGLKGQQTVKLEWRSNFHTTNIDIDIDIDIDLEKNLSPFLFPCDFVMFF